MDILIIKIMGMAFPQPFVRRNDISPCAVEISFLHTIGCGNAPIPFRFVDIFVLHNMYYFSAGFSHDFLFKSRFFDGLIEFHFLLHKEGKIFHLEMCLTHS